MLEMIITVGIVLLIVIVIALIISVFANITIGTPTPVNVLVKPISNKIGEFMDEHEVIKKANEYENAKTKSVKTYAIEKEHKKEHVVEKEHVHVVEKEKEVVKAPVVAHTYERTIDNRVPTKTDEKTKTLKK